MPRGGGKSTLTVIAAVWALVYGHRRFVCLIGANEGKAEQLLKTIKAGLQNSDKLHEDFPEVTQPIRALENDARRCTGQILDGCKTAIEWKRKMLVLPTVTGSACSGSIVSVVGITGSIRGQNYPLKTGQVLRPDFVIADDPQTRESAYSEGQCETRHAIMHGDVLGMAGPGEKIAAVCPCTVIRHGDLAHRLLDRNESPEWQGETSKMLVGLPTNTKLWEEYAQLRNDSLRAGGKGEEATEFYRTHQEEMDAGACASWPERFNRDEISAIQNAMNLKLRNEEAFMAEAQNEPREVKVEVVQLKPDQICAKLNGRQRGSIPVDAQKLTVSVDVQKNLLYWMIIAWSIEHFEGWVVDYGTYPEQPRRYFTLRQASPTLAETFPGMTEEAAIRRGLESLCGMLFARQFTRDDGSAMSIDKLLIDKGYKPDVVNAFIIAAGKGSTIMPSQGVGITAAKKPMSEYRAQPGEQIGTNWMIPRAGPREVRYVKADVNYWKGFANARLALPIGTKGGITLYGSKSTEHRLFADHIFNEAGTPTEGQGRQLVEFRPRPGAGSDNHLLDTLVGCAVGASLVGCGKTNGEQKRNVRRPSYRKPVYLT
jgi:hypothetical protein